MIIRGTRFVIIHELPLNAILFIKLRFSLEMALQVLFPYEDLVKFFQYEARGISPRGLFNCGNR
jgi:hypothetical protein